MTKLYVESTGASKANVNLITDNEADMAILQSDVISYAHTGTSSFTETGVEDNSLWVAGLYNETVQIIARPGVTDLSQIRGMTVCMGDIGSGTYINANQVLSAYGITANDVKVVEGSFKDGVEGIKNGTIDVAFTVAGAPTTAIVELAEEYDFNLLSVSDEAISYISEHYPFLVQDNLPAGTYSNIDEEVTCVAVKAALVASERISSDAVYEMIKSMFNYKSELMAAHAKFQYLDPAYAIDGAPVPLHPGAERYYREVGVVK